MKIFSIILLYVLILFFGSEKSVPNQQKEDVGKDCIEATTTQEVQSFYTNNPESQTRNKIEIWDDGDIVRIKYFH